MQEKRRIYNQPSSVYPIYREGGRIPSLSIDTHEIVSVVKKWQQAYVEETSFWKYFLLLDIAHGIPMVHKIIAMH